MASNSIQLSFLDDNDDIRPSAIPEELFFNPDTIRRVEHEGKEYFSLVDLMTVFSDTKVAKQYWSDTKKRLKRDNFDVSDKILRIPMRDSIGRMQKTDCADGQTCLRIIQSIPSPKAEPVREWFAQLGYERLEEMTDPELGVERAYNRAEKRYEEKGKSKDWIATRLITIDDRKIFTDALSQRVLDIQTWQYGQATNAVYIGLWGRDAKTLKTQAGVSPKGNLRDVQHRVALHYQGIVEAVVAHHLGEAEAVTYMQAIAIIDDIASTIGVQANEICVKMGIDLPTNRPLLPSG